MNMTKKQREAHEKLMMSLPVRNHISVEGSENKKHPKYKAATRRGNAGLKLTSERNRKKR